ncbi:MAG: type II toxin-antitoxin system PemK/MazF family toxin [Steroidobacteraceae bacterium]
MNRGDVCWYTFKAPDKKRPVLVLMRDSAIAILHSVTVAPITPTIRSIPTEVVLTEDDRLPNTCAAPRRSRRGRAPHGRLDPP